MSKNAHKRRVLAHQEKIAAELKALAASPRKPPKKVTTKQRTVQ